MSPNSFVAVPRWSINVGWLLWLILICLIGWSEEQGFSGNSNYMEKQLLCALDKAPCDKLGSQIKRALPEIIGNNCGACDQRQAANAWRIAKFVQTKYPEMWNALVEKYARDAEER